MSKNFSEPLKFKVYVKNPLSKNEIENIYKANEINGVSVDLYLDIVQSLTDLIFKSYLGDEYHDKINYKIEHFDWCWKATMDRFKNLGYEINNESCLIEYFGSFFMDIFYSSEIKDGVMLMSIKDMFEYTFNYNIIKSKLDVDNFIELYNIFNKSIFDT